MYVQVTQIEILELDKNYENIGICLIWEKIYEKT